MYIGRVNRGPCELQRWTFADRSLWTPVSCVDLRACLPANTYNEDRQRPERRTSPFRSTYRALAGSCRFIGRVRIWPIRLLRIDAQMAYTHPGESLTAIASAAGHSDDKVPTSLNDSRGDSMQRGLFGWEPGAPPETSFVPCQPPASLVTLCTLHSQSHLCLRPPASRHHAEGDGLKRRRALRSKGRSRRI